MFRTVIFDLDGTLLNTLDDLADAGNRVCAVHGWQTHPVEAYRYFVGNGIPKLVERISPADKRDAATQAAVLAEFKTDYAAHMRDKTAPYTGMTELVKRLHTAGVKLAVYSNKADEMAANVVGEYFDLNCFDVVRGARPDVAVKPHPAGTLALLQTLNADLHSTLYVGDSNVDVQTAHNAGLPCCGVLWGFRTKEELLAEGAEYLASNAQELEKIIWEKR